MGLAPHETHKKEGVFLPEAAAADHAESPDAAAPAGSGSAHFPYYP